MDSILLDTLHGKPSKRPPVWFMRQAGRILPSYLKIKEQYTFWQMMNLPKVAAEVTLLPIYDLEVDAAILFSDILVVPYSLGMGLDFTDAGPRFDTPLKDVDKPLDMLHTQPEKLEYIYKVIDEILATRPENTPLIGFAGAPFTVICYMLQGLSNKTNFVEAVHYMYQNPKVIEKMVEVVTEMTIIYANQQINRGIEVFQLFETHGGLLPFDVYERIFLPAVKKIGDAVRSRNIPFIFFPKDIGTGFEKITPDLCDFVSIDWQTPLEAARKAVHPEVGLQGNLDPRILMASQEQIEAELNKYIPFGQKNQNWIFNLGHGFMPGMPVENAKFVVDWVKRTDWGR